jgi:hypothetical protein
MYYLTTPLKNLMISCTVFHLAGISRQFNTITMVVSDGPHPISIWTGPEQPNRFAQQQTFPLSASYFLTPVVVVMRSDAAPIHNVSQLNSMKLAGLMSIPPRLRALGITTGVQTVNPPNGLRGVAFGRFDAFLGEKMIIADELKITRVHTIKITAKLPDPAGFCIAVSSQMADFIPIFTKAIAAISKQKEDAIQQRWLGTKAQFHPTSAKGVAASHEGNTPYLRQKKSGGKEELSPVPDKTAAFTAQEKKASVQQKRHGQRPGESRPLTKRLWPAELAGAVLFGLEGLWLFFFRKHLQEIGNGIAALEPHLLYVQSTRISSYRGN